MCKEYINIQTGEVLDLEKVKQSPDNAMLKVRPDLWCEWDFEKNVELGIDVWKITKGSEKRSWWYCNKCKSSYDMRTPDKLRGQGCPYCRGFKVNHTNSLASLNPQLASEWHPTKNGDLTPDNVTVSSNKKAWWLCNKGHEWEVSVANRNNNKTGCTYCSGHKVLKGFNDMWTTSTQLASLLADSEDGYRYMQWSGKKVDWKCPKCNYVVKNRIISDVQKKGFGCVKCNLNFTVIKGEITSRTLYKRK